MNNNPMASDRGFFSGLANEIMDRKDEALLDASPPEEGRNLERNERLGVAGGVAACSATSVAAAGFAGVLSWGGVDERCRSCTN